MKQIAKTAQINDRLRAAYGADANLNELAVFETVALTTLPLRKAGGIFQKARVSLSLLSELATSVNAESVPLQLVHDTEVLPVGRFFYAEVVDDALRGLIAVDNKNHPDLVAKLDNGTIDQVSIGMVNKRLTCSGCGYDFMDPSNLMGLYTLTCDEGHTVGQDGVFIHVDGLNQLFELSLVGKGAADGARIVGPSDARLQSNDQFRLAASAHPGAFLLHLSPTMKELSSMSVDMARFEALVSEKATATAQLTAVTAERDAATTQVTTLTAQVTTLTTENTELKTQLEAAKAVDAVKAQADAAAALTALKAEAKTILTAVGKADTVTVPDDITAVLALITEHRAAFAAAIPVGGKSNAADTTITLEPARPTAAFRAPK